MHFGCKQLGLIYYFFRREDPSDSLVIRHNLSTHIDSFSTSSVFRNPHLKVFGTSSLRRQAQIKSINPEAIIKDVRGNINTRLAKLDSHSEHGYDCLILATAGLTRGGFTNRISHRLDWFYAVSQGALGIECRDEDEFILGLLEPLVDPTTLIECIAERTFMQVIEGGCAVPVGVKTNWPNQNTLTVQGIVLSLDGVNQVHSTVTRDLTQPIDPLKPVINSQKYTDIVVPENLVSMHGDDACSLAHKAHNANILGRSLANDMLAKGVRNILDQIKH